MSPRAAKKLAKKAQPWPPFSPAAVNAWLLLVTTKPPSWRDPLLAWPEEPPTFGQPHPGFFYPDPLGFWDEVRRWAVALIAARGGRWISTEALSVTTLLHVGGEAARLTRAVDVCRPKVVLFLDEPAWLGSGWAIDGVEAHHVPDPHRPGQVYQGFWARLKDGTVVGKSPQHPSTHRLYKASDMDGFLAAAPRV